MAMTPTYGDPNNPANGRPIQPLPPGIQPTYGDPNNPHNGTRSGNSADVITPGTNPFPTHTPPAPGDPNILMSSPTGPFPGWGGWSSVPQWSDPTMAQVQAQPGFQFGQQQGQQALEQDAAQKGLLYGGGTLKDILAWGNNYATQFYNNTRNQMLNSYQQNVGNWNNAWNQWDASRKYAAANAANLG